MALGPLVAAVAAVLCPGQVAFVDLSAGEVVRRVAIPVDGAALFAAPDGRVVVPARDADATVVVAPAGRVERWKGRLFPLFFDQPDRLHTVLPGALATLSYPERLPLARIELPGVDGARRAATSSDGRLVAIVPAPPPAASLVLVAALEGSGGRALALGGDAVRLAVAPDGGFAIVATAA
ncbi:MAG TPA: hypothetical protein VLW17_12585, partial [Thermoanaerobaculaceae bacterium]|nr:hypothetical protein [Thermoanaerobaculaceae bacterium]